MSMQAAERRQICSPRRKPWDQVTRMTQLRRGETPSCLDLMFRRSAAGRGSQPKTHGLRRGLQIYRRSAANSLSSDNLVHPGIRQARCANGIFESLTKRHD
jgi:hypothetical protein